MVVYIEIVLLENLIIDALMLWLVFFSLKQKVNWLGLVLGSVVGAVFALACPMINISGFLAFLLKLFVAFLMCVMLEFNFKKIFLKFVLFLVFTFAFGGCLLALFSFMGKSITLGMSFGYEANIPVGAIFAGVVVFFIGIVRVLNKLYKRKKLAALFYDIELKINQKSTKLKGFLDTGNTLFSNEGKPILIVSCDKLDAFFSQSQQINFLLGKYEELGVEHLQKKVVQSISGSQEICVFDAKCKILQTTKDVAVGVCRDVKFFKKGFDVILNSKILEENYV